MPRPKRPARAARARDAAGDEERGRTRGRARTTRSMGARLSPGDEDALREAKRARDAALDRLANEDATTTATDDDAASPVGTGRRTVAGTPAMRRDTTGLDLGDDDDVFGDVDESFADGVVPGGSASVDSTALSLRHFRVRSRQSSIVGRGDAPIRPSSRGPNTPGIGPSLNIGAFRRRAREPSILGTSRKPLREAGDASDVESDGGFTPEAESTPLRNGRPTRGSTASDRDCRASAEPQRPPLRKRKSTEAHDDEGGGDEGDDARPEKSPRMEDAAVDDSDSELSAVVSLPSPPRHGFGLSNRPTTPVNMDDITAPPASSDSEEGGGAWPDIHTLAKRRRRPSVTTPLRADGNVSDASSPPSLTHSPNLGPAAAARQRGRAATRRQASPRMTTADLTNLLPKRRYKRRRSALDGGSDGELDATDLGRDDDELSYLETRAARRRRGASRTASRARDGAPVLGARQTPASARRAASAAATYRRRRSSDKENESGDDDDDDEHEASAFVPLPDDTFGADAGAAAARPVNATDELKQAAKKFSEVDKWQLEYEEVAEPSSPQDAR